MEPTFSKKKKPVLYIKQKPLPPVNPRQNMKSIALDRKKALAKNIA